MNDLTNACAKLREVLDCDKNPGMIGSPAEVVLQAKAEIERLQARIAALENEVWFLKFGVDKQPGDTALK